MKLVEVDGIQFEVLPTAQCLLKAIVDPLRDHIVPTSLLKRLVHQSSSPLVQESLLRPGGWRSMKIVYANERPVDWMDRMAIRYNPISMETRNRRKLVTARLTEIVKTFSDQSMIHLLGIGAGPGLHLQDSLLRAGIDKERAKIWLIDRDSDSFEYGRQCAAERGLEHCVEFIQGDAREIHSVIPDVQPQVIKIVGLLEYLTNDQALQLLIAMRSVIAKKGRLLTHGLVDRYRTGPFLSRAFGLNHVQRTAADVEALLRSAGFELCTTFETPMKIYPIVVAKPV